MLSRLLPQSWTRSNPYAMLSPLLPPENPTSRSFLSSLGGRKRSPFCLLSSFLGLVLGILVAHSFFPSWLPLPDPAYLFSYSSADKPYYTPEHGFPPGTLSSVPHSSLNTSRFFPAHTHSESNEPHTPNGRPAQRDREFKRFPFKYPDEGNRFAEERLRKCLPRGFWEEVESAEKERKAQEEEQERRRRRRNEAFELEEVDAGSEAEEVESEAGDEDEQGSSTWDATSLEPGMEEDDLDKMPPLASATSDDSNTLDSPQHKPKLKPKPKLKSTSTSDPLPDHGFSFQTINSDWRHEPLPEGCGENERKIVLLNSWWFVESLRGSHTGEAEWAGSMMDALYAQNYTILFSSLGWMNTELWLLKDQYKLYEPFVKIIIGEPEVFEKCWNEVGCVKDPRSEVDLEEVEWQGVKGGVFDPWKMLSFHYWDYVANRLGKDWTLSPFPTNDHRFVSFSIEATCSTHPYKPFSDRKLKQAYIFGKQVNYLTPTNNETVWGIDVLQDVGKEFEIPLVAAMRNDNEATWALVESSTIDNVGPVDSDQFLEMLSDSDVFIGIGRPRISPSPFDALCMGVPFINPIVEWDKEDWLDRSRWRAQQWAMHYLEAPYVYNVHSGDILGLRTAVKAAFENPIESYIPDYMTFDYMCGTMSALVEEDWKGKYGALDFEVLESERKEQGEGEG